jgi:two-component system nitrate/nitrite response regulator NarL
VRAVHSGRRYISPSVAPVVLKRVNYSARKKANRTAGDHLTQRENEVLKLIAEGATTKEVASRLGLSPKTAQVHRDNIKRKLALSTTAAIVLYAIKHKVVRID